MTTAGMVSDKQQFGSCTSAGLPVIKGKFFELEKLDRALSQNIADAEAAKSTGEWARSALFGLRIVKATCDATISVMGEFVPGGEAVSVVYSSVTPMADIVGKASAGQSVGAGDWTKAVTSGAVAVAKKVAPDNVLTDIGEQKKIVSDVVVDAMAQDVDGVIKDMADNMAKIGQMSANYAGKKTIGKFISAGKDILKAGYDIALAYKEFQDNDMRDQMEGTKRFFRNRQAQVRQSLAALCEAITDCEYQLAQEMADNEAKASLPRIGIRERSR